MLRAGTKQILLEIVLNDQAILTVRLAVPAEFFGMNWTGVVKIEMTTAG